MGWLAVTVYICLFATCKTVKSTEKVSRLRESPLWEQLLPSTCLSEMPFFPSRSLEFNSTRTGGDPDHSSQNRQRHVVGTSHYPSRHCPHREDDFCRLQCLISTSLAQDMVSQRLKTAISVAVALLYGPLHGQKASKL